MTLQRVLNFNFYPRSPCGERRNGLKSYKRLLNFYPRSPCGERRHTLIPLQWMISFLSTLSLRRATRYGRPIDVQLVFLSTLSLRRATFSVFASPFSIFYFYPRSPCGERLALDQYLNEQEVFLSTLSLRRATSNGGNHYSYIRISIHALLAESDIKAHNVIKGKDISIHALLAESDRLRNCF